MNPLKGKRLFLKVLGGVALSVLGVEYAIGVFGEKALVELRREEGRAVVRRQVRFLHSISPTVDILRSNILQLARWEADKDLRGEILTRKMKLYRITRAGEEILEEHHASPAVRTLISDEARAVVDPPPGFVEFAFSIFQEDEGRPIARFSLRYPEAAFLEMTERVIERETRDGIFRFIIVSTFLAVFLYWVVIRPVKRIIRANETAAGGDLRNAYIPLSEAPKDEMGDIIKSHNRMLRQFQNSRFIIRENNKVIQSINEKKTETNRRLRDVDRLKSQFLANMSHELRTPLNAIIGFAELTLKTAGERLTEKDKRNLDVVVRQATNLLHLINEILDLSKIESGRMEVFAEEFEIDRLVDNCIRTMEPLAKEKSLIVESELCGSLPLLCTDRTKVRQILLNLLSNAVKFTPEGSVRVTVVSSIEKNSDLREGSSEPWIEIAVKDTGIGIDEPMTSVIFEEFRQVDGSITKRYPGTGLGLSIARKLARMLGGDLSVASVPQEGSTFTLRIPAALDGD